MNRLKSKASRFFKDGPSQDEKAANASIINEAHFDAGIEGGLRKKPSRFFRAKSEKPLPAPPFDAIEGHIVVSKDDPGAHRAAAAANDALDATSTETNKPLWIPPVAQDASDTEAPPLVNEKVRGAARKTKPVDLVLKKRPSFASLRSTSSRIFRTNTNEHDPPPPPMPQIPIDTPAPKPRHPTLRPFGSVRSTRSSRSSSGRVISISRPQSSAQVFHTTITSVPTTIPFTKPQGPPPPRPQRPESLDDELIALMHDGSARMVLHIPNRVRSTTTTTSTSSGRQSALTRVGSEEAYIRLGLPSGRSSLSSPKSPIFDSPLAAKFPFDPSRPPFRDSSGSAIKCRRFSTYIRAQQQHNSSGYTDGVDQDDREVGPIEQYRESKCGDWTLERRVSGKLVERGMLFRDRWGGWHFVADF